MKKLIKSILLNKFSANIFMPVVINVHNFSYKLVSLLATVKNKGIHPKHQIMNYHKFFVDNIDSTDKVLDVGCGNGENTFDIAKKAESVVGMDILKINIMKANKNCNRGNITYFIGDAIEYEFKDKFDKVILSNVLEHIEDRTRLLMKISKISTVILLRVPLITRDWISVYKKNEGFEYRLDKTHKIEYTLEGLKKELAESGWVIKSYSIQFGELWGVLIQIK